MLVFLIDNIFVKCLVDMFPIFFIPMLWVDMFFIPMGTKCAPLLNNLSLYSLEIDFMQGLQNEKKLVRSFYFHVLLICRLLCSLDNVLSPYNAKFGDYVDCIYNMHPLS